MPFIEDFGQQAAQELLGAGLGIVLGGINDRRQLRQQEKLQGMQIRGQKEMTDYQMRKQLEMWDKTNYSAQVAQLHKAGLNPALLYGKGGPGGATAAVTPGNVTGTHAPIGGGEAMGMGITMANMGLLKAQKENIEASTQLTKAQAAKTAGVDTTLGETQIQSLLQGVQNAKAQQKLTELQTEIGNVQLDFDKGTLENRKSTINLMLSKLIEETKIMENQRLISDATIDTKIGILRAELALKVLEQYETKARTINIDQQTRESINNVRNLILKTDLEWFKYETETLHEMLKAGIWKGDANELKDLLQQILIVPGRFGKPGSNPIPGFHDRKK